MSKEQQRWFTDELIREAVRQELDGVQAPPVDQAWQRLQARLADQPQPALPPQRRRIPWSRYSAVAAACLLFVLAGVVGVNRAVQFVGEAKKGDLALMEAAPDAADNIMDGEQLRLSLKWESVEVGSGQHRGSPPAINGFTLIGLSSLTLDTGRQLLAAEYTRNGDSVLRLFSEPPFAELPQLLDQLQAALAVPVVVTGTEDNLLFLIIGEQPALAWLDPADGSPQVLWAPSGSLTVEALTEIARRLID